MCDMEQKKKIHHACMFLAWNCVTGHLNYWQSDYYTTAPAFWLTLVLLKTSCRTGYGDTDLLMFGTSSFKWYEGIKSLKIHFLSHSMRKNHQHARESVKTRSSQTEIESLSHVTALPWFHQRWPARGFTLPWPGVTRAEQSVLLGWFLCHVGVGSQPSVVPLWQQIDRDRMQ